MPNLKPECYAAKIGADADCQLLTKEIKEELDQKTSPVAGEKTLQRHPALGPHKDADEKTKLITSQSAAESEISEDQANTKLPTGLECCDGVNKHVPDSARRDGESQVLEETSLSEPAQGTREDENESDHRALTMKDCNEEKKRGLQKGTSEKYPLYSRKYSVSATCPKQKWDIKTLSDGTTVIGPLMVYPTTEFYTLNDYRLVSAFLIHAIYNRIRCSHDKRVPARMRRTEWADEPSSAPRELVSIPVAYSFADPYEKV